jgi:NDP-sugar pyrophosphorylase family protein
LGSITDDLPKPMIDLNGKPLLEHTLDRLAKAGIRRALIVTGYKAEMIESHFAAYNAADVAFVRQLELNGTGAAALLAQDWTLDQPFLLTFGDVLTEPHDYRGMIGHLVEGEAVIAVKRVDDPWQGAAVYERHGRVTRIIEKPPPGTSSTHWNSAGSYVFRQSIFTELEKVPLSPRGEYEITTALQQLINAGRPLLLYSLTGGWRDVGRPDDIAEARRLTS